ncbi:MAG: TonB-dependent receptor [Alloprevotella sp.]|nr:TonB-dependent receptor [Alloprevotella sp.]
MKKGVKLTAAALLMASGALAQTPADSLSVLDNADFTFTESQLDEDNDAAQTVSTVTGAKSDPYNSEVGYLFSAMRFKVRAYDNMYNSYYLNGLQLNDLELGRFGYSMVGGMNDATRNQEGLSAYDFNRVGIMGVGGGTSVNSRASQFAQGNKLTLSGCNRNYVARGMYTHATGILPSGWAFAGQVGYRWASEGVIEGTFYNSFSYFLAAEKRFNDHHSLSLVTFGSPTERAQQGASTEEAYWLANSHYYNPNWGYQGGEKRNARVVNDFEPTAILTWDWKINDAKKLTTAAGFKYSMYSSTALSWSGDAYDPRPDYYKNLPSGIFDVYDPEKNNPDYLAQNPYLLKQYNDLVDFWTGSKANRQINWDRMYYVNRQSEAAGGEALYYQERRHNDQMVFALNSAFSQEINRNSKYTLGLSLNATKGMHYKTMADLLGAHSFTDIDKFAANDYGINSIEAQNDLRHPNRQIGLDDKFGYNYNIFVNKARAYGLYELNQGAFSYRLSAYAEGTTMEREGLMQNGRAPQNSYGKSGQAKFLGGGGRFGLTYRPSGSHILTLNFGCQSDAPLARNSFVAPRMQNNFVDNLTNEQVFSAEAAYQFRFGNITGKLSGYYTRFNNGVEQTAFYNDQEERFTYLTMSGVDREHYGLEAALKYQLTSNFSMSLTGTVAEAQYVNNPLAQVAYEGMNGATLQTLNRWTNPLTGEVMPLCVIADGMRVSGTPLTALSLGLNYNVNGWFFEANLNYYDRVYVDFSEYRRLSNVLPYYSSEGMNAHGDLLFPSVNADDLAKGAILYDNQRTIPVAFDTNGNVTETMDNPHFGQVAATYSAKQEKFKGGFMLDLSVGRYIRLKGGKSLSINLQVQNATNNRNLRTGGYEQNRDDFYNTGVAKAYRFSKNSKYYYANAINAFLNVGFKF